MQEIYSYGIADEVMNNQLAVYVNNILVAYVLNRKVTQVRNLWKFINRVLDARDKRKEIVPVFTYKQLYRN